MIIKGTIKNASAVSFIEVASIKKKPPIKIRIFLKATETEELITDRIKVVSVVKRDKTSPLKIFSKKDGLIYIILPKISFLISETILSPNLVTKKNLAAVPNAKKPARMIDIMKNVFTNFDESSKKPSIIFLTKIGKTKAKTAVIINAEIAKNASTL